TTIGVTVNDMPGFVHDGVFAALVPVDPSVTSLTASLNDLTHSLASDAIAVTVSAPAAESVLQLRTSPSGGVAPLTAAFSLSSLVAISHLTLDSDGNGAVDFQGSTLDGVEVTYAQPGVYVPTVQVTDVQGHLHTAATLVHVSAPAVLDAQ